MEKGRPLISSCTVWLMGKIALGPPESSRPRTNPCVGIPRSPADSELVDDRAVALRVPVLEVLEEPAPLADQHEQPPARVMVLAVLFEVVGQPVDALGEQRDLDFGRAGVAVVGTELLDQA